MSVNATLERFSRHLEKSVDCVQIFLSTRFVKISFSLKYFQRHREACAVSPCFSIVKMRLTMMHER